MTVLFGALAAGAHAVSKSIKLVDTEEKKHLREVLESYRKTRDKNVLKSVSMEQVLKADHIIELDDRIIPYSSISEVRVKEFGKVIITQQVRTGLAAEIYGSSTTWKFDVLEDNKLFLSLVKLLQQLLPSKIFTQHL